MTEKRFDRIIGVTGVVVIASLFVGVAVIRKSGFDDRYGKAMQEYRAAYATWKEDKRIDGQGFTDGGDRAVWQRQYNRTHKFKHPFPKRRDYR